MSLSRCCQTAASLAFGHSITSLRPDSFLSFLWIGCYLFWFVDVLNVFPVLYSVGQLSTIRPFMFSCLPSAPLNPCTLWFVTWLWKQGFLCFCGNVKMFCLDFNPECKVVFSCLWIDWRSPSFAVSTSCSSSSRVKVDLPVLFTNGLWIHSFPILGSFVIGN